LFQSGRKGGKTATQNKAVPLAAGEIIVFTDADTRFSSDTLLEFSKAFEDGRVGGATGRIVFERQPGAISPSQGYYWTYEMKLRRMESALGCLAVASGQCMAIRKSLFMQMPEFVGEDCIVPLDIVLQGYRYAHVDRAVAYDVMEHEPEREMRTRIRMTMRNWTGTWLRSRLLNPFRFPCVAFALWSHKLIRWLSPFFMIGATVCTLALPPRGGYLVMWIGMASFYAACVLGWLASLRGRSIPMVSALFSFALANIGFLVGVTKALRGGRIHSYRAGHL
jgi:cellulose synthase/poly-beta-1,6-N-acetylglucosamine synthase-like glycosyltransferase